MLRCDRWLALCLFGAFAAAGCPGPTPSPDGAADQAAAIGDLSARTDASRDLAGPAARDLAIPVDLALYADSCTAELPCKSGICYAPGEFRGCGICRRPGPGETCTKDSDCAAGGPARICDSGIKQCYCGGELVCQDGCKTVADCGEGQVCGADHRCQGTPCDAATPCPPNFACGAGRCVRRTCAASSACQGYCVKGQCYGGAGQCSFPPP